MILFIKWQKRNVVEFSSIIGWKVKLVSDELGYLAEDISQKSVEDTVWFLLVAYCKI